MSLNTVLRVVRFPSILGVRAPPYPQRQSSVRRDILRQDFYSTSASGDEESAIAFLPTRTSPASVKLPSGIWGSSTRRSQPEKATSPSPMRKAKPQSRASFHQSACSSLKVCCPFICQDTILKTLQITLSPRHSFLPSRGGKKSG